MRRSFYILHTFLLAVSVVSVLLPIACANRGVGHTGPQGGPRDSIPPVLISATPENKTINFREKKIELLFDEYLQMDRVAENVMISPPQRQMPDIKALGKKVVVQLKDSLRDSTTYTIDFGRSICDFREKNPYPGYSYCFSTGDNIDTLEVSGMVYWAETLDPVSGVVVGIHSDMSDETVLKKQFLRVARSDSTGGFVIRNIHGGSYRIYALNDISKDYVYQLGEAFAYLDSTISPRVVFEHRIDTTWIDSVRMDSVGVPLDTLHMIDTIVEQNVTRMEPSDIVLWLFDENRKSQYLQRCTREDRHRILITFAAPLDSMPRLEAPWIDSAIVVSSARYDTIAVWLPDSSLLSRDTLEMVIHYWKLDSGYNQVEQTDTLPCLYRSRQQSEKVRAAMEKKERERKLEIKSNGSTKFGLNDTLRLSSLYPLDSIDTAHVHLYEKVDSVFHPRAYQLAEKDRMHYLVLFEMGGDRMFELRIDSGAIHDIYGVACQEQKVQLRVRQAEEYAQLTVRLKEFDPKAVLQLLDDKGLVVRTAPALQEGVVFRYLDAGTYYMRLFIDEDGDGKWTTGSWKDKRHPETIYYFPSALNVRANWDFEEEFDHLAKTPLESKPQALRTVLDITKKKK